jgi:hypothetical protein
MDWQGWDGRTTFGEAQPGIYYYWYKANGWGPFKTGSKELKGSGYVYLFR